MVEDHHDHKINMVLVLKIMMTMMMRGAENGRDSLTRLVTHDCNASLHLDAAAVAHISSALHDVVRK